MPPSTKLCKNPQCALLGQQQPLENFYNHKSNADGRQSECKVCYRARVGEAKKAKAQDPLNQFYCF